MKNCWRSGFVHLKFRMGEINLFAKRFPFLILDAHFTMLNADLDNIQPPFGSFPPNIQGALIRSHPIKEKLSRLSLKSNMIWYVPSQYKHYYTDLGGSFENYLKGFSSKSRSTLKRKIRKFAEFSGGEIGWREFCGHDEMQEFHRLARVVSEKTYQERLLNAGLPSSEEFRQKMLDLASNDSVRGYILLHGDKPIAYLYCPIEHNILMYEYLGYDPEYRLSSAGTVLQYLALEKLFTEGRFQMFDFTEGEGEHKKFFATGNILCADIYLFHLTAANMILLCLHFLIALLSRKVGMMLKMLGIKGRIRRFLRFRS